MSPAEIRHDDWGRELEVDRVRPIGPAVLAAAASLVALWPYTAVIEAGAWTFVVVSLIVVIGLTGVAVRSLLHDRAAWLRSLATLLAQLVVATCTLTLHVASESAAFGLIPTARTVDGFGILASQAAEQVLHGTAPLVDTLPLRAMIGLGFAAIAILIDHLIAQRSTLIAALLVAVVGALPMIITVSGVNVVWFVMLGVLILILLRFRVRHDRDAPHGASAPLAATIGVLALAGTVVIAPALPVSATGVSSGTGVSVSASLRFGDDLRRPTPIEVLTIATKGKTAPYLRLATLSRFDGRVWHPDEADLQTLAEGFGDPDWNEDVAGDDRQTSIRILRMSSSWLPVPYPATRVQGLSGAWRSMPENRTVVARTADAAGNDYTVTSAAIAPTLEQIRASSATGSIPGWPPPEDLPPGIGDLAAEVIDGEATDYDRLIALQSWFRNEFTYSLETPVEEGFDGTGAEALAQFLEVRSGYCIHFAGAFALMAQSLDMPVRIVVGYLPGTATDQKRGKDETIFSVRSDQLHSWPEVFFSGIGWVPFEPTASLGVPTRFLTGTTEGGTTPGTSTPVPTSTPGAVSTTGPEIDRGDAGDNATGTDTLRRLDPTPVLLTAVGIVLLLVLPALIRRTRRMLRLGRARDGDAAAAWDELRDTLIDLRLPVSPAHSPRVRGLGLVGRGADAASVARLTDALERASYARTSGEAVDLAQPLTEVISAMTRSVDRLSRVRALFLPRSLVASREANAPLLT